MTENNPEEQQSHAAEPVSGGSVSVHTWLHGNKIYFETVAAVTLSLMAIIVSTFQMIQSNRQNSLANQLTENSNQLAAAQNELTAKQNELVDIQTQIALKELQSLQEERLSVQLNPYVQGEVRLTGSKGFDGYLVHIPWKLTLSNTGNRQLSITEYRLTRGENLESMWYTGIDGGLVTDKSQPVEFPITLDAGESRFFFIFVGIMVPEEVQKILSSISNGKPLRDRDATKALGEKGLDIYGNPINYHESEDGKIMFSAKNHEKAQRFWIQITSGRGNSFVASAKKSPES